jgi:hypothetical protein
MQELGDAIAPNRGEDPDARPRGRDVTTSSDRILADASGASMIAGPGEVPDKLGRLLAQEAAQDGAAPDAPVGLARRTGRALATGVARLFGALAFATPAALLAAVYLRRLALLRQDPSLSTATQGEAGVALFILAIALGSLGLSWLALTGRLRRTLAAVSFLCVSVVCLVLGVAFVGL